MTSKQPARKYCFMAKIEADTRDCLVMQLNNFAMRIRQNDVTSGIMGGSVSSAIYKLSIDPHQTHDKYFAELNAELSEVTVND